MPNNSDGGIVLSVSIDSSEASSDMKKVVSEINKQVQAEAKNVKAVESVNQAKEKTAQAQEKTEQEVYKTLKAESQALVAEQKIKVAKAVSAQEQAKVTQEEEKGLQEIENTKVAQEKVTQAKLDTEKKTNDVKISQEKVTQAVNNTAISHEKVGQTITNSAKGEEQLTQAIHKNIIYAENLANIDGASEQAAQRRAEVQEKIAETTSEVATRQQTVADSISETLENADDLTKSNLQLEQQANNTAISGEHLKQSIVDSNIKQEQLKQNINQTAVSEENVYQAKQKSEQATINTNIKQQKLNQEVEKGNILEEKKNKVKLDTQKKQQDILIGEQKLKKATEDAAIAEEKHKQAIIKTEKAQNSLKKATDLVTNAVKKMASILGIAFSVKQLINFSNEASELASQTEAYLSRLGTLYGEYGEDVYDWANKNANSLGMAKSEAYEAAASFGNLFTVFADSQTSAKLSKEMLQTTAVIASQTGRTYEETFEKIQSGLYGNTRAIDDLGISVRQASLKQTEAYQTVTQGVKSWNDLTDAELQQVRALAIVEQANAKYGNSVLQTSVLTRSQFNAAWTDFKATWGQVVNAVLMPILKALTYILNTVTSLMTTILGFFGVSFKVVNTQTEIGLAQQQQVGNQKDLNKELGKTNKKMADQLQSFDKINKLSDDTSGGSGTGGSGTTSPSATSPVTLDIGADTNKAEIALSDFVTNLKEAWENGDYFGIGVLLGKAVNKAVNSFISNTDWDGLKEKIDTKLKSIMSGFNSFISTVEWDKIAQALSNVLSLVLDAITSFIESIDFEAIGVALIKFVQGIDWKQVLVSIGNMIVSALSGAADFLIGAIKTIDWLKLFQTISTTIWGLITEVDWSKLISKVFELLGTALAKAVEAIADWYKFIFEAWQNLWSALKSYFEPFIKAAGGNIVQGFLAGILIALMNISKWIKTNIFDPFIKGFKKAFGIHSPSKKMMPLGENIVQGLKEGIGNVWEKVKTKFTDFMSDVKNWINGKKSEFKKQWNDLIAPVKDKTAEFKIKFANKVSEIKEKWNQRASQIKDKTAQAKIKFGQKVSEIREAAKQRRDAIKEVFSSIPDWFKDKFSLAWQKVKDVFSSGGKVFTGIKDGILSSLKSVINGLIGGINRVISIPFNGINTALKKIKEISILGTKPFSDKISLISVPQIPRLAKGAVIPPNREFLAVLGDQKRGTNIEAPANLIKQMVEEGLSETQYSFGSQEIRVPVYLDSSVLFEAIVKANEKNTKSTGVNVLAL